jgi:transposase-like protein
MRGIKVPEPVKQLIIERVKNGDRVDDLASEFDLYPNTIRKWLAELGVTTTDKKKARSEALEISKLNREKEQLLAIIGELTVLTRQSKKKSKGSFDH